MSEQPDNVTQKTWAAVARLCSAEKAVSQAKADANRAECELLNAQNDLGRWIAPADGKPGEVFHIWVGSGLLAVEVLDSAYRISWRKKPDGKDRFKLDL